MTTVEEIEAAHAKLGALRAIASAAPWAVGTKYLPDGYAEIINVGGSPVTMGCNGVEENDLAIYDAELIVTLVSTIDAQLAILEVARQFASITPTRFTDVGLELARAINGGTA